MEMTSSGIETQKAMRQPQLENVAPSMDERVTPMMMRAKNMPSVAVVWIQAVA